MKNRLISAILAMVMILSAPTLIANAEYNNKNMDLCLGLGFIDNYKPEQVVTRGYFASILANMLRIDTDYSEQEWQNSVYGEKIDSETVELSSDGTMFDDVDKSYPYYNEIMAICNLRYMKGTAERRFAPEYDISILEVVKVLCDMAGYAKSCELSGGYPAGYEKVASNIGLLSNIDKNLRTPATQEDILKIISNILSVDMMELTGFSADNFNYEKSDKTFMQGVLKTYMVRSTLTDNGITALSSSSSIAKDEIKVGEVIAVLPEKLNEYRKLIGRQVEMYYTYEDDDYTVRYIRLLDNDKSYTFSVKDLVEFKKGQITFEQGNKTITKKINQNANLIYNNKCKSYYKADIFNFESGDITICATDSGDYNTIIINDYKTVYVENVSINDSLIYNGFKTSNEGMNIIDLSSDKYPDYMSITDGNGKVYTIDTIPVGSVLSILETNGAIEVIVTENKVKDFVVKTVGSEELNNNIERVVLSDGETEYSVLKSYSDSVNSVNFYLGNTYTLYLNHLGEVAYALKAISDDGTHCGILMKVFYDEEAEPIERILTIYTEDGEKRRFSVDEKIKINDMSRKFEDVVAALNKELGNPVLYKTDKEGLISSVVTACAYGDSEAEKRGWCRISPEGDTYRYGTNGHDFDRFFYYVSGRTKVFQTPLEYSVTAYADDTKFQLSTAGFGDNDQLYVEGFAKSPDSAEADVIVWRKFKDDSAIKEGAVDTRSAFLIENVSYDITNDDESALKIRGYLMKLSNPVAEYKEFIIDPEAIMVTAGEVGTEVDKGASSASVGPRTPAELEAGDVIRFETNSKGYISAIRIGYDMDNNKPYLAGNGTDFAQGSSYSGYAISKSGNTVKLATALRPETIDYTNKTEVRNSIKSFIITNAPVLVVEKKGKKVTVSNAAVSDVLSYKDSASGSKYDNIAIFTYYSALVYGMVIYK